MILNIRNLRHNPSVFRILVALGALAAFAMTAGAPRANGS